MTSLFDDFDDDLYADDEPTAGDDFAFDDEFDQLRASSAGDDSYDDEFAAQSEGGSSGGVAGTLSSFTPQQRLILAILLVLDIFVGGLAILLVTGVI